VAAQRGVMAALDRSRDPDTEAIRNQGFSGSERCCSARIYFASDDHGDHLS
jgi:hypothetical protein